MSARDLLLPLIAVLVLAGLAFSGLSGTLLNLLIFMMIISLAAQGWNILGGFGGLSSFGHAAFFGTGAYATLILQTSLGVNAWLGLVAGVLLGAADLAKIACNTPHPALFSTSFSCFGKNANQKR